jgi:hypothetical protein
LEADGFDIVAVDVPAELEEVVVVREVGLSRYDDALFRVECRASKRDI